MATVASFNVALVASTGRFVGAISRAERQWNQFARSVQRGAKQLPEAIRAATPASLTLGRYVARFGAVAAAAFSAASIWGVRLAAQFEQTRMAMATMLGSVEDADRFLKELEKRARRTPFGFQQLVEMARQMLAWGFARQEIEQMLDPIGDFVAAMGGGAETIDRVVRALGQIRARGKLASQEMLQLTEAGIPAWELLAKSIGTSIPEAMDRVSKGAVPSAMAVQAIIRGLAEDPRFAGAMERQARTLLGQWEQLKDGLTTIIRGLGEDIIKIANLGTAMRRLNEAIGRFADLVSEKGFMNALREAFPPWLPPVIIGIAGAIAGGLVPVIVALLLPALKKLRASIAATGLALWKWMVAGAAIAVVVYLLARYWNHLGDVARAVWSAIGAAALYGASLVVRGIGLILAGIGVIIPAFRGVASSVLGLADSLKSSASGLWASAKSSVAAANQAAKSQSGVAEAGEQAAQTQQNLAKGMEGAAKAAAANIQSFDEVHQIQEEMADSPAVMDMPAMDLALDPAGLGLVGGIGDAIGGLAQQVEETTGRLAQSWQTAVTTISQWWDALKTKALETFPWLRDVADGFAKVADWVRDNWSTVGPILEGVAGVLALVGAAFLIATNPIAAFVAGAALVAGIAALIIANWETVGPFLIGIWQAISPALIAIWEALKSAAITIWNALVATAKVIWEGLKAWWFIWGDNVLAILGAVWNQIVLTIQTAINLVNHIVGFVLAIIKGDWDAAWEHVKGIATTVWNFLVGTAQNLWTILQAVWQGISAFLTTIWNGIKGTANAVWSWITDRIAGLSATSRDSAIAAWNWTANALANIWNGIKNTAQSVWDGIGQIIRGAINWVIGIVNKFIDFWNRIKIKVPSIEIPLIGKVGGFTIGVPQIPRIPLLAEGGNIVGRGLAMVGEAGPEILELPRGARVTPLSGGGGDLADEVAQAVYQAVIDAMRTVQATTPAGGDREIVLRIDGRTLARATLPHVIAEGQRQGLQLVVRPQGV